MDIYTDNNDNDEEYAEWKLGGHMRFMHGPPSRDEADEFCKVLYGLMKDYGVFKIDVAMNPKPQNN